jgi:tetratricopeptide (TPR) repeat protein
MRQECTGVPGYEDLDDAVESGRAAVAATPTGDPDLAGRLCNLSYSLQDRFERSGSSRDLDEAIEAGRAAVRAAPDDHLSRAAYLSNLVSLLLARSSPTGSGADLEEAVRLGRAAVTATRAGDPGRARRLSNLGTVLKARFERTGSSLDLEEAVLIGRAAVTAAHADDADRADYLSNLSTTLGQRFLRAGAGGDLDEAVQVGRAAVQAAPGGHRNRAGYLSNLAGALHDRFVRTGSGTDLDEAVNMARAAVAAAATGHPGRAKYLSNLGMVLRERFERTGSGADLDEAVEVGRAAVATTPVDHHDRAIYLSNLSLALRARYDRTGSGADLDEAVDVGRAAVAATPTDQPSRANYLHNLASAQFARIGLTGPGDDLDGAVDGYRAAIAATPADHPNRAAYLSGLGNALGARYWSAGSETDLDEAVQTHRQAVAATPADHPARAGRMHNLSHALRERYASTRSVHDLDEAVRISLLVRQITGADHPRRATYLKGLGDALFARFQHSNDGPMRTQALQMYREGARVPTASPLSRMNCGRPWASVAAAAGLWQEADQAWGEVLGHLPTLVDRGLHRTDRQRHLSLLQGAGSEAACAAVAVGDLDRAWATLEQGRGVLLSQALETRTDTSELRRQRPDLADQIDRLRRLLNTGSEGLDRPGPDRPSPGEAVRQRELTQEWERLLADVRSQPGFDRFGMAPTIGQLRRATATGAVVAIIGTAGRYHALILQAHGSDVVDLPDLAVAQTQHQVIRFLQATHSGPDDLDVRVLPEVLGWLWDTVAGPVLEYLGHSGTPAGPWPRIWWIPTGPLSGLPLHAAGHHGQGATGLAGPAVLDRVISSYVPTARALLHARRQQPRDSTNALVVGVSQAAGLGPLTSAVSEAEQVHAALRARRPPLLNGAATRRSVRERLPDAGWVHLACHAADAADPAESYLALSDGPLPVRDLTSLEIGGYLAYLSACSTAFGGTTLPDESIHIASALHLAGFAHVVGTLWPIPDTLAPRMAMHFYRQMLAGVEPAVAVHHAVRAVREKYPRHPQLWAAHIHLGP